MADHDTHLGAYSVVTRSVHAYCGVEFVPIYTWPGNPADPDQICPQCAQRYGSNTQ